MKRHTKEKISEAHTASQRTGGGPPEDLQLSATEEAVASILTPEQTGGLGGIDTARYTPSAVDYDGPSTSRDALGLPMPLECHSPARVPNVPSHATTAPPAVVGPDSVLLTLTPLPHAAAPDFTREEEVANDDCAWGLGPSSPQGGATQAQDRPPAGSPMHGWRRQRGRGSQLGSGAEWERRMLDVQGRHNVILDSLSTGMQQVLGEVVGKLDSLNAAIDAVRDEGATTASALVEGVTLASTAHGTAMDSLVRAVRDQSASVDCMADASGAQLEAVSQLQGAARDQATAMEQVAGVGGAQAEALEDLARTARAQLAALQSIATAATAQADATQAVVAAVRQEGRANRRLQRRLATERLRLHNNLCGVLGRIASNMEQAHTHDVPHSRGTAPSTEGSPTQTTPVVGSPRMTRRRMLGLGGPPQSTPPSRRPRQGH